MATWKEIMFKEDLNPIATQSDQAELGQIGIGDSNTDGTVEWQDVGSNQIIVGDSSSNAKIVGTGDATTSDVSITANDGTNATLTIGAGRVTTVKLEDATGGASGAGGTNGVTTAKMQNQDGATLLVYQDASTPGNTLVGTHYPPLALAGGTEGQVLTTKESGPNKYLSWEAGSSATSLTIADGTGEDSELPILFGGGVGTSQTIYADETAAGDSSANTRFTYDAVDNKMFVANIEASAIAGNLTGNVTGDVTGYASKVQTTLDASSGTTSKFFTFVSQSGTETDNGQQVFTDSAIYADVFSNTVYATTFNGDLVGDSEGFHTGDVLGDVEGDVTGNAGSVTTSSIDTEASQTHYMVSTLTASGDDALMRTDTDFKYIYDSTADEGTLHVKNLNVTGTTTTVNTEDVIVKDKTITLAVVADADASSGNNSGVVISTNGSSGGVDEGDDVTFNPRLIWNSNSETAATTWTNGVPPITTLGWSLANRGSSVDSKAYSVPVIKLAGEELATVPSASVNDDIGLGAFWLTNKTTTDAGDDSRLFIQVS